VATVDELEGLLSQEGLTYIDQHARKASLTQSNIIGIIPCDAGLKYLFRSPKRLFSTIVSFSYINISQSSVATQLKCGGIFNTYVIANCPQNVTVKEFLKSVNIWRRYGQRFGGTFLWLTMYILVIF